MGNGEHNYPFKRMSRTDKMVFSSHCTNKMQPTDLTVAGCGVCMMLPGTILPPGMGVLFFWGYTSVIFRFKRNFSHPTVHCFFKVGNSPVSS